MYDNNESQMKYEIVQDTKIGLTYYVSALDDGSVGTILRTSDKEKLEDINKRIGNDSIGFKSNSQVKKTN